MGLIGYFGSQRFETSSDSILPLQNFQRTAKPKTQSMDRIGLKSRTEYTGPDLGEVTFTIIVNVELGQQPRATLDNWVQLAANGTVDVLVIGGKALGDDMWMLTNAQESWNTFDGQGNVLQSGIALTFDEYSTR